jgi:hypothetical protein
MEFLDLLVRDIEKSAESVAVLELGDKWMGKKVILGTFFVGVQGIVEN